MIEQALPLALSVNTVAVMWLAGSKRALGWVLGLAGQGLWIVFTVVFEAWGLLLLTAALIVVYGRNLMKWRQENDVTTDKESDYRWDWLTVVGIDTPYPPLVAEALERVERETARLEREVRQAACAHANTERFLLRKMNGQPCTNETRCEDCGASVPEPPPPATLKEALARASSAAIRDPGRSNSTIPIMIEWGTGIERLTAEVALMRPLMGGRMAESITYTTGDDDEQA